MKKRKFGLDLLIPLIVAGAFALLNLVEFYRVAENRVYDLFLHLKPAAPESKSLLFIDIEDSAIARVGTYPWSRDIMADGLIVMKEFGASYAVFDIEYVDRSPRGVNAGLLEIEIPELFGREFATIDQNIRDLFQALRRGTIALGEAQDYIEQLTELTASSRQVLLQKVNQIARDNDSYLGNAARVFGNAFFTVNMVPQPEENVSEELRQYTLQNIAIRNIRVAPDYPHIAVDIRPAILPVLKGAKGAGFPNVIVDGDGVRRRIDLVAGYGGRWFAQLGFAALLDWLGNPELDVGRNRIVVRGAEIPGKGKRDISLPLSEDGHFLINWPKKGYLESFRHLSFWPLVLHQRLEKDLLHNLKIMEDSGYLDSFQGSYELMEPYRYAEDILRELLEGGDPAGMEEYVQARDTFFRDLGGFLSSKTETELLARIDALLASRELREAQKADYRQIREEVPGVFGATRELYNSLAATRATLREYLPGSFCIIGWTGTSTTDVGVNPFEKEYMNVGTHGSVVNTILSGLFLDSLPWWISALAAGALAMAVFFLVRRTQPLASIVIGLGFLIVFAAAGLGLFLATGIYSNMLTPLLSVFFTLFALILFKFLVLEKEKSFIRNAFSHYLSTDVINELILDPSKLNLGGEKKQLTAMFTDVRGFSSISEALDPTDLVKLLNAYLTEMSNIILALRGTIDKYEGDAIIAFFGAPMVFADHAARACSAAVRMKKMEKQINEHFLAEKLSPAPLVTRIGVNSGEMVVGNMGTAQKMDYTIMGNSVNLAARLEGVNKQYGTGILVSEATRQQAGEQFVMRQLDRVRVVGIQQPVRLFELIDEKDGADAKTREAVEIFHRGQALFESRHWKEAAGLFEEVTRLLPGDGPSGIFLKRCGDFIKTPPAEDWDGVFSLTAK